MQSEEENNLKEPHSAPGRKIINIFADFETFVKIHADDFSHISDWEEKLEIITKFGVITPGLLCYTYPHINNNGGRIYNTGNELRGLLCTVEEGESFFEELAEIGSRRCVPKIGFHNSSYDIISAIHPFFLRIDPDLEWCLIVKESNNDFIKGTMKSPKYGFTCYFGDTMQYQKMSLGAFGEIFNIPKGEMPYNMSELFIKDSEINYIDLKSGNHKTYPLEDAINYCSRDVELVEAIYFYNEDRKERISRTILNYTPKSIRANTLGNHSIELAKLYIHHTFNSCFLSLYRHLIERDEFEIQEMSSCGGFTSLNKNINSYICNGNEKIYSYDGNSLYPSIISEGIPGGEYLNEKPKDIPSVEGFLISVKSVKGRGLMECLKIPPIPDKVGTLSAEKKFYIPKEVFKFVESNAIIEGLIIHRRIYQIISDHLGNFSRKLYKLRMDLRDKAKYVDDEVERDNVMMSSDGVKKVANSLYGKLCEKTHTKQCQYAYDSFVSRDNENIKYHSMLSGIYISGMGRLTVYRKILKVLEKGGTFLYADTDSVKFVSNTDNHSEVFGINTGGMGEGKLEGTYDEFSSGKRKTYMLINYDNVEESVLKMSGIGSNWQKIFMNSLLNDFENTIKRLRMIFSPKYNILIRDGRKCKKITDMYSQPLIVDVDVQTNNRLKRIDVEVIHNPENFLRYDGNPINNG